MSTTIRVSKQTHAKLHALAREADAPLSEVVDQAIELYRRQRIFAQANAAYAALYADSVAAAGWRVELEEWDATLADGLEGQ